MPSPFNAVGHAIAAGIAAVLIVATAAAQEPAVRIDEDTLLETGTLEDNILGSEDAPVTIVEYASMTCPHCAAFHKNVLPGLKEKYIDTGKVRLIFREFPLDQLAAIASMVARCVDKPRYFPFVSILFSQQSAWVTEQPIEPLKKLAKQAGLTDEAFDKCLANQELLDGIVWIRDRAANDFDVGGTPTFFVNGELVHAAQAQTLEMFEKVIEPYLGE